MGTTEVSESEANLTGFGPVFLERSRSILYTRGLCVRVYFVDMTVFETATSLIAASKNGLRDTANCTE